MMERYEVARKKVTAEKWRASPVLSQAKAQYDAGVIELATGRDGRHFVLYAYPRQVRIVRPERHKLGVPYLG